MDAHNDREKNAWCRHLVDTLRTDNRRPNALVVVNTHSPWCVNQALHLVVLLQCMWIFSEVDLSTLVFYTGHLFLRFTYLLLNQGATCHSEI